jgi:hypothetical protein
VPAAWKPYNLSAGAVSGKRSINAEQARQVCRAVGSDRERASRQTPGRRLGQIQHGWEAGSLLAQAQTRNEQTAQSLRNHRTFLDQTSLTCHFDVLRILKTCKFPQRGMSEHGHESRPCFLSFIPLPLSFRTLDNRIGRPLVFPKGLPLAGHRHFLSFRRFENSRNVEVPPKGGCPNTITNTSFLPKHDHGFIPIEIHCQQGFGYAGPVALM